VKTQVPGTLSSSPTTIKSPHLLEVNIPRDIRCHGYNANICIVRCRNKAANGPFGGCAPVVVPDLPAYNPYYYGTNANPYGTYGSNGRNQYYSPSSMARNNGNNVQLNYRSFGTSTNPGGNYGGFSQPQGGNRPGNNNYYSPGQQGQQQQQQQNRFFF
jgi:hypothetical protein